MKTVKIELKKETFDEIVAKYLYLINNCTINNYEDIINFDDIVEIKQLLGNIINCSED